jgi:hypothetical protein
VIHEDIAETVEDALRDDAEGKEAHERTRHAGVMLSATHAQDKIDRALRTLTTRVLDDFRCATSWSWMNGMPHSGERKQNRRRTMTETTTSAAELPSP